MLKVYAKTIFHQVKLKSKLNFCHINLLFSRKTALKIRKLILIYSSILSY